MLQRQLHRIERNFVVRNEHFCQEDCDTLFGPLGEGETVEEIEPTDIFSLLVECGIFPSKSQARKNWNRGELKEGWNCFDHIGKLHHTICVLIPKE